MHYEKIVWNNKTIQKSIMKTRKHQKDNWNENKKKKSWMNSSKSTTFLLKSMMSCN